MNNSLYSQQSESKILGLLLSSTEIFTKHSGALAPEDFYIQDNRILFDALVKSVADHGTIDITFLLEELIKLSEKSKEHWVEYVAKLSLEKGLEANVEKYIELIKEKKQSRELQSTLTSTIEMVNKGGSSVASVIGHVESQIQDITRQKDLKDFEDITTLTSEFLIKMEEIKNRTEEIGVKTGIAPLDKTLGNLLPGQFIVIAARPSMGKTAVALEIAKNAAKAGKKVGFFSIEMPSDQLIKRMLASEAMISTGNLYNKNSFLNQNAAEALRRAENTVMNLPMRIDDSSTLKIDELAWKARKVKDSDGLDMIIIDYLQLIDSDSKTESRQQMVSEISRKLKALSRDLEIPVIALSQLSRGVEKREKSSKKPMMSDIRESGAIEQDADIIMLLYRSEYYKDASERSNDGISDLEIIIGKNRNGETGSVNLAIDLRFGKISSITGDPN